MIFISNSMPCKTLPCRTLFPQCAASSGPRQWLPSSLSNAGKRVRELRCEFEVNLNGALSGDFDPRSVDRVQVPSFFFLYYLPFFLKKKKILGRKCMYTLFFLSKFSFRGVLFIGWIKFF